MRIYVTGGTGYLGGELIRRLAGSGQGHEIRALVRESSDTSPLAGLPGVSLHHGDILDRFSMREGMSGADWVVHAAAYVDIDGDLETLRQVNVQGTENVASLACKLGVGRFLHISSVAAFGGSPADGSLADESSPVLEPLPSAYSLTKHEGELHVRAWAERGLRVTTVYPSLIYGPPGKKRGSNVLLRSILKGRFPVLVGADRKTSWVYIEDVVEALIRILHRGHEDAPSDAYILAGDVVTTRRLVEEVCRLGEVSAPKLSLPVGVARVLLTLAGPLFRLRGRRPPVGPGQLRSLARHWAFDDSRARRELDWAPRSLAQGLAPTVAYIQEQDALVPVARGDRS